VTRRSLRVAVELFPFDRQCNGRAGARARRVGSDRRRLAVVAQIVDENLAAALALRHRRRETTRILAHDLVDHCTRELLDGRPLRARHDGHHDV